MRNLLMAAALLLCSLALNAQTAPVELTFEPGHRLALQNRYTRVFQVEVPPHAATQLHLHRHDYVYVTLGAAEIENEVQGKPPVMMKLADGQTELSKGPFAHVIRNTGNTPFRNVTIEILRPPAPASNHVPRERGLSVDSGFLVDTVFDTDEVRVLDIKLMPGASMAAGERNWPRLMVAVSELRLRDAKRGKPLASIHLNAGDLLWTNSGPVHTVVNTGLQPARWVEVEFK